MSSKEKRRRARELHQKAKRRAKVRKVLEKYRGHMAWGDGSKEHFEAMITELSKLNVKYLQQLVDDLTTQPGFNDPNKELKHRVELTILERTILK